MADPVEELLRKFDALDKEAKEARDDLASGMSDQELEEKHGVGRAYLELLAETADDADVHEALSGLKEAHNKVSSGEA